MLTRSKINYSNVNINNLINTPLKRAKSANKCARKSNVLLFDIESVQLKFAGVTKWIPHQISWGIYNIKNNKLDLSTKKNYYVSEIWINPDYNNSFSENYKNSHKKHIEKVINNDYPMKTSRAIISKLLDNIKSYNVDSIFAYNIYQDFDSLKNMITFIPSKTSIDDTLFNCKYSNPFRMNINYCDLMHNIGIFYMDHLITEGFKDNKIFRNSKTKMIKLKGRDNGAGIYSAEYVLHNFFGASQTHIADEDVDFEAKILEKIVSDFGLEGIEYNVMYPAKLYDMFASRITTHYAKHLSTAYLFAKVDVNTPTATSLAATALIELKDTEQLQENPCNDNATDNCPERAIV